MVAGATPSRKHTSFLVSISFFIAVTPLGASRDVTPGLCPSAHKFGDVLFVKQDGFTHFF